MSQERGQTIQAAVSRGREEESEHKIMLRLSSIFRRRLLLTVLSRSFSTPDSFSHQQLRQGQAVSEEDCSSNPVYKPQPSFSNSVVLRTLSHYSNDRKLAFDFFNWLHSGSSFDHTTDSCNRMIDILCKFSEFSQAWDLIDRMRTNAISFPNRTTFRILFKRYAAAHLVQDAITAYNRSEEFDLKDEITFSHLIDALCECKHVVEAEEICFSNVHHLNTKIYNMILRGWLKLRWWSKCSEFWEEMDKRGVEKDLFSYSIYMNIQCKCGKPWKAVRMYNKLKKMEAIKLDIVVYNTAINAIGQSEGVDSAVRVFHEMADLGCHPTVETYNVVINLLCQNGRIREAHNLFVEMSKRGYSPNVVTYQSFLAYLEKPRQILKLFDEMIGNGVRPRLDTYTMLMRKFGKLGFLRPVFLVWKKMEQHGPNPDKHAYNALIDALLEKGLIDIAKKYDEEMLAKGLSAKPRVELNTKLLDSIKSISST